MAQVQSRTVQSTPFRLLLPQINRSSPDFPVLTPAQRAASPAQRVASGAPSRGGFRRGDGRAEVPLAVVGDVVAAQGGATKK